jgi:hypothetical protein
MSFVLPEVVVQKVISYGIKKLRSNKKAFDAIFCQFTQDELSEDYGEAYREQLWKWFSTTKIPVLRAWQLNAQTIPAFSVHLASESEDESKAAMSDYAGTFDEEGETGTAAFTVMVDIGIHANRAGDHVLWMYYILSYILFKYKPMAHRLGLKLHTFSASDYNKEAAKMAENVWTRWVRFRCTTQNFWAADAFMDIEDINTDPAIGLEPASDIAVSSDVNIDEVSRTSNDGIRVSHSTNEDDDLSI